VFIHNLNFIANLKKESVFTFSTKKKDFIFFRKNPDIKIILAYILISIVEFKIRYHWYSCLSLFYKNRDILKIEYFRHWNAAQSYKKVIENSCTSSRMHFLQKENRGRANAFTSLREFYRLTILFVNVFANWGPFRITVEGRTNETQSWHPEKIENTRDQTFPLIFTFTLEVSVFVILIGIFTKSNETAHK